MDSRQLSQSLSNFRKSRKSQGDYYGRASKQMGVSDDRIQSIRGGLEDTAKSFIGVDPSVTGRTQGSLVSEAQRRTMVGNERSPLADVYRTQADALSNEADAQQILRGEASAKASTLYERDETTQKSLQKQYKTRLKSEQEAARRRAERAKMDKLLSQSRQVLGLQSQLADLSRGSDERMARLDRMDKYGFS